MKSKYLKISEVAKLLDVNRSTVFRWIEKGYLKSQKLPSGNNRILEEIVKKSLMAA